MARRYIGDDPLPKVDTRKPGEPAPGEDVNKTRMQPAFGTAASGYATYRPYQGPSGTWHWGVDIITPTTTNVRAPEAMHVEYVWTDNTTAPFAGYGPAGLLARGDSGVYHLLAHLDPAAWTDSSRPTKGQTFDMGEEVGFPAPTGSPGVGSSRPHVHWEVRIQPIDSPATRAGNTLDPFQWAHGFSSMTRRDGPSDGLLWLLLGLALALGRR